MRIFLSQILLAFYLLSALAPQWLEEFAKFPALLSHYQAHRTENPGTTLSQFISQHYGKAYESHRNQHDHSKLPGKAKHSDACVHLTFIAEPVHCQLEVAVNAEWIEPKNSAEFAQDQTFSSAFLSCIWQPPRA